MHTEVFNNIDILINMANSSLNIDEINMELTTLKRQIRNKTNEIEDLKSIMTDARYFNASNELVDKNIEISLKSKISRLKRKIKEQHNKVEEIKANEKSAHEDIATLKETLAKNEKYLKTLQLKAENSKNNKYYVNLLNKEEQNVKNLNKELSDKQANYRDILINLEENNTIFRELNESLEQEKNRLNDVLDNLKNPNAYIDEDLKKSDEEKLADLDSDLQALELRKTELLNDAAMLGNEAKELIASREIPEALEKITQLVNIAKSKPYMDITSESVLAEELEKKESQRVEISTLIDNKSYKDLDSDAISKKLAYLKEEKEHNFDAINIYQNEINKIDNYVNDTLGVLINDLESEILNIEKGIANYRKLLSENKSTRSRANIENAINKKEKERTILNNILTSYKDNLLAKIAITNALSKLIEELEIENKGNNYEQENLEKISMIDFNTRDLLEEESDKEALKQINEEIKAIKNRQKFDKTPDEIFDQIDMLLATLKVDKEPKIEKAKSKALEIDNLFGNDIFPRFEIPNQNKRIKVVEMMPIENIKPSDVGGS